MADSPHHDSSESFTDRESCDFAWSQAEVISVETQVFAFWIKSMANSTAIERWMSLDGRPSQFNFGIRASGPLKPQESDRRLLVTLARLTSVQAATGACIIDPHRQKDTVALLDFEEICRELDLPFNSEGLEQVTQALDRIGQAEITCKIILGINKDHNDRIPQPTGRLYYGSRSGPRTPKDRFWRAREYDGVTTHERVLSGYKMYSIEPSGRINGPLSLSWSRHFGSLVAAIAV